MDIKQSKLSEAQYFLKCMQENSGNQYEFNYELSAFLSAARSVLQYVYTEVKGRTKAKEWYDNKLLSNQDLKIFKELRDENIHAVPVSTIKHATSSGQRTHYFNTQHTQEEVLSLAQRYVNAISDLLSEGKTKGYLKVNKERQES